MQFIAIDVLLPDYDCIMEQTFLLYSCMLTWQEASYTLGGGGGGQEHEILGIFREKIRRVGQ